MRGLGSFKLFLSPRVLREPCYGLPRRVHFGQSGFVFIGVMYSLNSSSFLSIEPGTGEIVGRVGGGCKIDEVPLQWGSEAGESKRQRQVTTPFHFSLSDSKLGHVL